MLLFLLCVLAHQHTYHISPDRPFQNVYNIGAGYTTCLIMSAEFPLHVSTFGTDIADTKTYYTQRVEMCTHQSHANAYQFEIIITNLNDTECIVGINEYWTYHQKWFDTWTLVTIIIIYIIFLIVIILVAISAGVLMVAYIKKRNMNIVMTEYSRQ